MDSFQEKELKDQLNEALHSSIIQESDSDKDEVLSDPFCNLAHFSAEGSSCSQSFQNIKEIFEKTEAMKEVAMEKNQMLEQQFKDLKQKLSSSSEYLLRIKKNIENLKFSYQQNVLDLHNKIDPAANLENSLESKEDMAKHMEEIRRKIDDLQNRMTVQREKQQHVSETYQEAFDRVVDTLQQIDSGSYSSQMLNVE